MAVKRAIVIACCLTGFVVIANFVKSYESLFFDSYITEAVYSLREPALTYIFIAITYAASWQVITLICLIILFYNFSFKPFGWLIAISVVLSSLLYLALKEIFGRIRPDEALWLVNETGYGFPSGHSMTGLVFYGLIIYHFNLRMKNRKAAKFLTALLSVLILLIGFSRVYLGVHYPTDVLAGFCMGAALLFLIKIYWDRRDASVKENALCA